MDKIIYVGSYTEEGFALNPTDHGITALRLYNDTFEELGHRDEKNITFFHLDRQRLKLYAVSEARPPVSALHRYDIEPSNGELSDHIQIDFQESGGCFIGELNDSKGSVIGVAFYESGVVRVLRDMDTRLESVEAITFKEHSGVVPDRQEAPHSHAAYPLPSGDEFLIPDLGADLLYKVRVHGKKVRILHDIKMPPGSGPRHVVLHPKYPLLFVVSELANTLTVYEVDGNITQLTQTDRHSTLGDISNSHKVPFDVTQIAAHLQLSADGRFVLVSNRGRANSVSVFRIADFDEGKLELVQTVSSEGHFPRFFELIDDKRLLIANQLDNSLVLYKFDSETGRVSGPVATHKVKNPAALAIL